MQLYCKKFSKYSETLCFWSGRRDSNPRLQPWQGCALPLSYARIIKIKISYKLTFCSYQGKIIKHNIMYIVKVSFVTI